MVHVPSDAKAGSHPGTATVLVKGIRIAQVRFIIKVGDATAKIKSLPIKVTLIRRAFASYASEDRIKVLSRIQGMKKVLLDMEIFVDVMSLHSGDDWEQKLWSVIRICDVFFLFWSANAMRSTWVEREWRFALKTIGLNRIEPVPLVSPKQVPLPRELARKHFNDPELAYIQAEEDTT